MQVSYSFFFWGSKIFLIFFFGGGEGFLGIIIFCGCLLGFLRAF